MLRDLCYNYLHLTPHSPPRSTSPKHVKQVQRWGFVNKQESCLEKKKSVELQQFGFRLENGRLDENENAKLIDF